MENSQLLALNSRGFFPGPTETEDEFLNRVSKADKESSVCEWTRGHLRELFDFEPQSLKVFYSNKNLAIWQGAACWIDVDGSTQLQLREGFRKGTYLGLYSREEILAHEAVHAARAAFDEAECEEFFAYATSEKRWRQVLGPILKKPYEAWVAMGVLAVGVIWPAAMAFFSLWIGLGFWRLIRQHRRLAKASLVLWAKLKDQKKVRAVLLRLTDREVLDLSLGQWPDGDHSLRWRLIRLAYLGTVVCQKGGLWLED